MTAIEPGHQCYKVADIPDTVEAGTNATIQLEYWSSMDDELGGRNQSFFACADIVSPLLLIFFPHPLIYPLACLPLPLSTGTVTSLSSP